MLAQNKQTEV